MRGFKLVRNEYYKVSKGTLDVFFKKSLYINKYDGAIETAFITEETYYKNLEKHNKKRKDEFFEIPFEEADKEIKEMIINEN